MLVLTNYSGNLLALDALELRAAAVRRLLVLPHALARRVLLRALGACVHLQSVERSLSSTNYGRSQVSRRVHTDLGLVVLVFGDMRALLVPRQRVLARERLLALVAPACRVDLTSWSFDDRVI